MRRVLKLAGLALASFVFSVAANPVGETPPGDIDLFGSVDGTVETVTDQAPGLISIYVVMVGWAPWAQEGATGVEFAAPKPPCFNASWLSDQNQFAVVLGNTQTGYSVGFGSCKTSTVHICTMQFFGTGSTPWCCTYWVVPHPYNANGRIEGSNCVFELLPELSGGATIVNRHPYGCPVATESATWGEIKSLYAGE